MSTSRVEEFKSRGRGWDYQAATVSFADSGEVLLSRERDRVSLCINSFSTPGVVEAPLVDVGAGAPADYEGKDVKGAVVLGSGAAGQLWQQAVKARGAIGVISTSIAAYIRPERSGAVRVSRSVGRLPVGQRPVRRGGEGVRVQGEPARRGEDARAVEERSGQGEGRRQVDVLRRPEPLLVVAEMPGTVKPDERIVMVAHIQEPGANDDGSGCGTLLALVLALHKAIAAKALAAPGRTLTFIWGDENRAQPRVADRASGPGEGRAVHVLDGHDRRGRRPRPAAAS